MSKLILNLNHSASGFALYFVTKLQKVEVVCFILLRRVRHVKVFSTIPHSATSHCEHVNVVNVPILNAYIRRTRLISLNYE